MVGDVGMMQLVAAVVLGSLALRAVFRWLTKREPVFEGSTRPAAWVPGSGARFAAKPDPEEEGASWTLHSTQRPPGEGDPAAKVSLGRQWWTLGGTGVTAPGQRTEGKKESWDPAANPNPSDALYRGGPGRAQGPIPPRDVSEALRRGVERLTELQEEDGHLAGDYGGPMFLLPGLVIACHVVGHELGGARRAAMRRFLRSHQQADGGWGLHIESASTMFGTALNYVALRLLGEHEDAVCAERARAFLQRNGGAVSVPSWGKFWLALAGLYEWEGLNPIPPELWLLPNWFPFHPGRMWCHCRMVYLPMSYIYGGRFTARVTDLTHQLRREIYTQPYDTIDWASHRNLVSDLDLYFPHTPLMKGLHVLLGFYERVVPQALRRRAMDFALEYIHAEDAHTNYVDIGPVNKSLNMASVWFGAGCKSSEALRKHTARIPDYLWVSEDGEPRRPAAQGPLPPPPLTPPRPSPPRPSARHENVRLQRLPAVGHDVRDAGHVLRAARGARSHRLPARRLHLCRRHAGSVGCVPAGALLPPREQGRVALQHRRPRLAHLGLHRGGRQSHHAGPVA